MRRPTDLNITGPFVGLYRMPEDEGHGWMVLVCPDGKHMNPYYHEHFNRLGPACRMLAYELAVFHEIEIQSVFDSEDEINEAEKHLNEMEARLKLMRAQLNERREKSTTEPPTGWELEP